MEKLSKIAVTQPHAAYAAFKHIFLHLWSYIAQTVPMFPELFCSLDDVLRLFFTCSDWPTSTDLVLLNESFLLCLLAMGNLVSLFRLLTFLLLFHLLVILQPL